MKKNLVIAVVGATAIGKTKLAIELAKHFKTEIISADSRQFFKEMTIGTAVPSNEELIEAKHHFIQHISIKDAYSVGDFEKEATAKLNQLFKSHNTVILVGGSGMYVDAVVKGLDDFPEAPNSIREELNQQMKTNGLKSLQELLKKKDPVYYEKVDLDNPHRVIRALEVCIASGKPFSSFLNQLKPQRNFKTLYVGINAEREIIYRRINLRVDKMMQEGLLSEAKHLHQFKNLNALNTIGYKELFSYLEGKISLDEAVAEIKKNTRRFAKRQLTWYRKNENIIWVDFDDSLESKIAKIKNALENE
ncbi:tRNA dimethylallyltransferase [Croceivirga lutea]|uniref:tRNA (adenosine(37)-N6)-dimethylallyltransferase MiaA n=1 Tax=Croceivirga lutea TaxID=1775167 RepID=UPI00163A9B70|nr:tRNA (adenosine(37)-N6)-dimethylallyltransferase MiaA [Croceivirga lutea]GGG46827.1 tRNA dimethylallyltransferase [Croceivirga lutea]